MVADEEGSFALPDVSLGRYKMTVYLGARRIERLVDIVGPRTELSVNDE